MTPPVCIRDLVREGEAHLVRHDVPNARRNAEWILCRALGCTPLYLHVNSGRIPGEAQVLDFRRRIARRAMREPLQHVLETAAFMSLEFEMRPGVFVPRPETETVVDLALRELRTLRNQVAPRVLDLCCGSGVIGVAIASQQNTARVYAVDSNPDAVTLSRRNAVRAGVNRRYEACCADATLALECSCTGEWPDRFDLIACNPPYIASNEMSTLPPEVRDWDPPEALDGGADGLDFYRAVAPRLERRLVPGGVVVFEIGCTQADAVADILRASDLGEVHVENDLAGRHRAVRASRRAG